MHRKKNIIRYKKRLHDLNDDARYEANSSVCLIKYNAIKAYGGKEVNLHTFLTSALQKCGPLLALDRLTTGEKPPVPTQ
jgi:hypothetical protein